MSVKYKEMSKTRKIFALVALMISAVCGMADMVITPIAANMYEVFAAAPVALVDFGITGAVIVGLPFLVVSGWACDKFNKRSVMLFGFIVMTLSTVFGAVYANVYYWVGCRIVCGIAWSFTNTASFAILADMFDDEGDHGKMVGWYNAAMSVLGAFLSFAAGQFALGGWQQAYLAYLIFIPALVLLILFLPSCPPVAKTADEQAAAASDEKDESTEATKGWWKAVLPLAIQVFFIAICYFQVLYMISLFVTDAGIGDEAFSGTLASVATIAAVLSSMVFGLVFKRLKNAVYLPGILVIGIGFIAMSFFPSVPVALVCIALMGASWPFYYCFFYTYATELVPAARAGSATSLVGFSDTLAMTLSSYLFTGLMAGTGFGAVTVWSYFGWIMLIVFVISLIVFFVRKAASKAQEQDCE
jgi:MFS family permease